MRTPLVAAVFLMLIVATPWDLVEAQPRDPSARPYRGLFGGGPPTDPNRSGQQLTATATVLAGHDDNLNPETNSLTRHQAGYRGLGDATLRYWRGHSARSLTATGRGYLMASSPTRKTGTGGDLQIDGVTAAGRTNRLSAYARASYLPFFTIGAFETLGQKMDRELSPDANPMIGLDVQSSWQSSASSTFERRWTPRNTTRIEYAYSKRDYEGESGFDSENQVLSADYTRALGRALSLTPSYHRSEWRALKAEQRITQQSVGLDVTYQKRLPRNRIMSFSGGVGATNTDELGSTRSGRAESWSPSGRGSVGVNVGNCVVRVDYRRVVSVLNAIAWQAVVTDAAFLQVDGTVRRRLHLSLTSGYSAGRPARSGTSREYDNRTVNAQMLYQMARPVGILVSYTYYEHRMEGFQGLGGGIPARFARNVVNVGFSLSLPLYGTWVPVRRPASE